MAELSEPRTDPRIVRTRHQIVDAFVAEMTEKGFEALTVQDVTERAGVNRATFYAHFDDKYGLLRSSIRSSFAALLEERNLRRGTFCRDSVGMLFRAVCEYVAQLLDHCKPPHDHLRWLLESEVEGLSTELLLDWTTGTGKPPDPTNELRCLAASCSIYGLALRWAGEADRKAPDGHVAAALPLILGILGL